MVQVRRDECMDKSFVVSGLRNFLICRILYMAIECFTANLAIMDWHWHRSVKSGAARIGNTWIVESPMAMESTEIFDNWWLQPSVFALLFNKRLWMNQSRKSEIQASTTARAWSWDKVSSGQKKDRVECHRHIHGHGHHHNIHIKPTNPFFKKNAYDLAFTLNIISLYFPENSEITDWNTTSKGGRGSEHCYLFTV